MDITKKIEQLTEKNVDNNDAFMAIAKRHAKGIAKDVSRVEKVSEKMLINDIYSAIKRATFSTK